MASEGLCGCDAQDAAKEMTTWQAIGKGAGPGFFAGGIFGKIHSLGAAGQIATGVTGAGLSGYGLYASGEAVIQDIRRGSKNWCNILDVGASSLGLALSSYTISRGISTYRNTGSWWSQSTPGLLTSKQIDWSEYPKNPKVPKPSGPFRILEGAEYVASRAEAKSANAALHLSDPSLEGLQIHEIQPIKFGGSPTDLSNKVALPLSEHVEFNTFWQRILRNINAQR